jgi:leader peptidase (prepilin peptidase) / N-methyltransferase
MAAAATIAFFWGLAIGSFVTVVAHRVPRGESILRPRSRCTVCGTQIAAYDNVPVISWVVLGGRSRCCEEPIAARYPVTELTLAVLYAATVLALWDEPTEIALGLGLVTTLTAVTLTDLERRIIPNKVLIVAAALAVAIAAVGDPGSLPERAIAAVAAGGLFFAAALAYPRGMGLGDVKLAAVMGLFLGRSVGVAILVALLLGAAVGVVRIARGGAAARKQAVPFGPFLAIGGVVALFAGEPLIDLYLGTFS